MDPKAANASSSAAQTESKLALDHVSCLVSPRLSPEMKQRSQPALHVCRDPPGFFFLVFFLFIFNPPLALPDTLRVLGEENCQFLLLRGVTAYLEQMLNRKVILTWPSAIITGT